MKIELLNEFVKSIQDTKFSQVPSEIEVPKCQDHGDYATPLAYLLAKKIKQNPMIIATELSQHLKSIPFFQKNCEVMPVQGYVNFKLTDAYLWDCAIKDQPFEKKGKNILLEYVSANPTGPLHIGHGRWAVLGSTLSAVLKYVGYDVVSEFYVNDMGNQIKLLQDSVAAIRNQTPLPEKGYHGSYLKALADQPGSPVDTMKGLQYQTLDKLGVVFDHWFSESQLHHTGQIDQALALMKTKNLSYEKDGALWFASTHFGDDKDRVLKKSDGSLTYFAVDVAYHLQKISRGFDLLINIWGADHHGYVPRVKAAVRALEGKELVILVGQLVNLMKNGEPVRMSKRTGEMITLDEVIEDIGVDATRFYLIQKHHDTHIEFDLDLAIKKTNENPVFYVQYAHARLVHILEKLPDFPDVKFTPSWTLPERELLKMGLKLNEECLEISSTFALNRLANFAIEYARTFHYFYETSPILGQSQEIMLKRVALLSFTQKIMKRCFALLGISAPTTM